MAQTELPLLSAMDAVTKATRKKTAPGAESVKTVEKFIGYRKIKAHAKQLEKGNLSKLIVFPSQVLPKEGEVELDKLGNPKLVWYKLGNFSALCYAYELGPRMGRNEIKVFADRDERVTKMQYIVSVNNIDLLKEKMAELGFSSFKTYEDGIIAFDLKNKYTEQDVEIWKGIEGQKQSRINEVILPKRAIPTIGGAIITLMQHGLPRLKKLERPFFEIAGRRMGEDIVELMVIYHAFADGTMPMQEAGEKMRYLCYRLKSELEALREVRALTTTACLDLGTEITNLKEAIESKCLNTKTSRTK